MFIILVSLYFVKGKRYEHSLIIYLTSPRIIIHHGERMATFVGAFMSLQSCVVSFYMR